MGASGASKTGHVNQKGVRKVVMHDRHAHRQRYWSGAKQVGEGVDEACARGEG